MAWTAGFVDCEEMTLGVGDALGDLAETRIPMTEAYRYLTSVGDSAGGEAVGRKRCGHRPKLRAFASVGALSLGHQCDLMAEAKLHRRPVVNLYLPQFLHTASHLIPWSSQECLVDQQVL